MRRFIFLLMVLFSTNIIAQVVYHEFDTPQQLSSSTNLNKIFIDFNNDNNIDYYFFIGIENLVQDVQIIILELI